MRSGVEWISSRELESLISRHPGFREAAEIDVPDASWGERPLALVVLKPGHALDPEGIGELIRQAAAAG